MRICDIRRKSRIRRIKLDAHELRVLHGLNVQLVEVTLDYPLTHIRSGGLFDHWLSMAMQSLVFRPELGLFDQPEAVHDRFGYWPCAQNLELCCEIILVTRVEAVDLLDRYDLGPLGFDQERGGCAVDRRDCEHDQRGQQSTASASPTIAHLRRLMTFQ